MSPITRQETLIVLQEDWATYVEKFMRLSPESRAAFLIAQGYLRLADLLAHVVAWWQVGIQSMERYLVDPQAKMGDQDVDSFNAAAVARSAHLDEKEIIACFEKARQDFISFVQALPGSAFADERVTRQLEMELVGHLSEHALPG